MENDPDPTTAEVLRAAVHDLKGPASRLRVLAQLLSRGTILDDDTHTLLQHITDSTSALDEVIAGLRNYSEQCTRRPAAEPVEIAGVLDAVLARMHGTMVEQKARVTYGHLPAVMADRSQVMWVFEELLKNAIRFGNATPEVHISATPHGEHDQLLAVVDNGPGIPADLAERAFRPFKKLDRKGGAGMGLTICRKIVELHGGRMWIEPESKGADVRFVLRGVIAGKEDHPR